MAIKKITLLTIILILTILIPGQTIPVKVSDGLNNALTFVNTGAANVIELVDDGGIYYTNPVTLTSPVTIKAKSGLSKTPTIIIKGCLAKPFITILNDFTIDGVIIDGYDPKVSKYDSIQHVFYVNAKAGGVNEKPNVKILNSTIKNIYKNGDVATSVDGDVFDIATGARVGDLVIENTIMMNTGDEAIRSVNTHKAPVPVGGNFCNSMLVKNCTFHNIRGSSIKIEGDGDSTNVDSPVIIDHCTFNASQRRVIWHRDLQNTIIKNCLITNLIQGNDKLDYVITFQGKGSKISHVDTFKVAIPSYVAGFLAETPSSWAGAKLTGTVDDKTIYNLDPKFKDAANGDFTLASNSPVRTLGSDGLALGDLRWAGTQTDVNETVGLPEAFELKQNYPNPFNPETTINFTMAKQGYVTLKVYNVLGKEIATLVNENRSAGQHSVKFSSKNIASGIYFYSLKSGSLMQTKKMTILK